MLSVSEAAIKSVGDLRLPIAHGDACALIGYCMHLMLDSDNVGVSLYDMTGDIKDFNTVIYNRREFAKLKRDAELGQTSMHFVDRAGDVHPGIDDADTICADFYSAMVQVLEKQRCA